MARSPDAVLMVKSDIIKVNQDLLQQAAKAVLFEVARTFEVHPLNGERIVHIGHDSSALPICNDFAFVI